MKMDVVGCGALNYDHLYRVKKIAENGGHEPILESYESPGGSAANTVFHLATLGKKTGFIGVVGRDTEGDLIIGDYKRMRVDTSRIRRVSGSSGLIIGLVDETAERTLYPKPGVNNNLKVSNADLAYANKARILHLSSFVSNKQLPEQIKLAGAMENTRVSFAPGHLHASRGVKKLTPILSKTGFLFLNECELELLAGCCGERALAKLHKAGAAIIIVTLGGKGCLISTGDFLASVPGWKSKVIDSTGAGDSFAAGFLAAVLDEKSLVDSAIDGIKLAKKVIAKKGAR